MSRKRPKKVHLFLNWLRVNRHRFPFKPQLLSRYKSNTTFIFQGITGKISFSHSKSGIAISAHWEGRCWDFIGDFDVSERRTAAGYSCNLCRAEFLVVYPTREELWVEHCFEPFLAWCHTKLSTAQWLEYSDYGGVTSAMLKMDRPQDNKHWDHVKRFTDNLIPYGKSEPDKRVRELRTFIIPVRTTKRASLSTLTDGLRVEVV